ncbi:MAG: N-6 DNA methylase [Spirochaetaceae bacterium]|nr:N-6 DNA methylase [Spirochaetaceae bacterium]
MKDLREQIKKLLAEKTDSEITEADKELLRQYEGGGGLAEKGATDHGTLYEFYTPTKVVNKVWELVDKYNPRTDKTVIEPSAGTGRFAENRLEKFDLFELDETSARIAGILHPDANIKQGYFQDQFMNGNTPKKNYTGKKYDVAIGNPPYGAYSGKHKGLGEGKGHSRIEEYFIDRSLDTLNDGGILAMVVPSSFLRGKNSKAKEKIAGKARLLEAWRLPNGTFGTTGIGTDIIILRKEKGDPEQFNNNAYFETHENQIIGHETEKMGRFGMEKYVALPDGVGFDEALDSINPGKVSVSQIGELSPEVQAAAEVTVSAAEEHENRSQAMMGNENAAGDRGGKKDEPKGKKKKGSSDDYIRSIGKNMSVDEYNKKYGVAVDTRDMPIWAATDYDGRIEVAKLPNDVRKYMMKSDNFTVDANGNWMSIANYASGNIYDKLDLLEKDKDQIIKTMGQGVYDRNKALLEAALPQPKAAENIHVSPISDFAKEYKVKDDEDREENLRDAFKEWAGVTSIGYGKRAYQNWNSDRSPISEYEIPPNISFNDVLEYINQKAVKTDKATARDFDSDTAKMEAAKKREARRECAERLFNRFIREGLKEDQRKALINTWNRRYNSVVNPDYSKIPVFVDGMNTHKGEKEFSLIKEQVEGISFLCNKGNGILAHDVGVGKTVQGEAATVNQIKTGRAKRPLVCVPKAVYTKWIKEFHQHFPDMAINELGNFSDKDIARFKTDSGLNIPDGTISVCTYEALQKVTFKDETISTELIDDMMDSQTIYDEEAQEKRSAKELAEERQKMMERLGKGAKSKEGALFWEDTGFDCITIDEIHNFKNVFGQTRSFSGSRKDSEGNERQANEFKGLTGGEADRAMKLFAITQLIQKQNNGRNVFGLSATPFTNSPIEVYNMLSLVARNKLKDLHIYNMYEFLAEFAEIKSEWSVAADGEIKEKEVMKNWKNLGALQKLITEYMHYVNADEAGVVRPRKKPHIPQLELTSLQRAIIQAETTYMTTADPKEDPGATLKAINNMRMATLSPASINPLRFNFYRQEFPKLFKGVEFPESKDFVSTSPKMTFVCDSVAKSYKQKPDIGQYIYLPRGVNDFVHVKQYLMDQGMPEDSIAFMSSNTSLDEKERIKNDFNDKNGRIKVIIGSETIKEGVSLNGNTATGYNCMLGWNPTETTQVEGRGWRQGNRQGHFHMVYPLMADSIDALMYQKYDEKSSRINEIWSYKGDTSSDVSDINPEELKFDLIKDPAKKANLIVGQKRDKVRTDIRIEEARYEVLYKDRSNLEKAEDEMPECKRDFDEAESVMLEYREKRDAAQKELEKAKKYGDKSIQVSDAKRVLDREKWNLENATSRYRREKKIVKELQDTIDVIHTKFRKLDIKPNKVDEKLKDIAAGIQRLKKEETAINDSYKDEVAKAKRELEAQREKLPPLKDMIEDNVRSIMGDLRPMDDKLKAEIRAEAAAKKTGVKKALVIIGNRLFIKAS